MNLKKNLGRIATAFVATAMLASLTAVPASAEGQPGEFVTINDGKITMTKNLEMPADVVVPGITFTFDIDAATAGEGEQYTSGGVTLPVKNGVGSREGAGVATISANQDTVTTGAGEGNKIATATVDLTLPEATYTEAGVYKYTIDEQTVDTTAGYTDKTDSLDLYLIVTRDNADDAIPTEGTDSCSVTAAFITKAGDKETKKAEWLNYYKLTDDGQSDVGTITVQKKIAGAMGNKSDKFEFTVAGLKDRVDYTYSINDEVKGVLNTNTENGNKVTLGHEDTLKVIGLEDGANITITEVVTNGYECTKVTNDNNEDPTDGNVLTVNKAEPQETVFTNSRDAVSPTGIVMDIAPYALLVVVAAAGCFVFLRKRRED